ncbi:MAG: hypothetical protein JKX81_10155 [Arenicella sp.]|nr:hypothetical protein [Arenicella sp.]
MKKSSIILTLTACLALVAVVAGVVANKQSKTSTERIAGNIDRASIATQSAAIEEPNNVFDDDSSLVSDLGSNSNESHILQISDLAKYPGFGHRDDEDEQTFSNEEEHRENLIADCMRESGFDYTPAPSIVLDESVLENEKEFERLLAEAATDPNQAYVGQLSPSMSRSYYLALTGLADPYTQEGLDYDLSANSNSCVNRAFKSIPGVYAKRNALEKELDTMESEIKNDQRSIAATQKWSNCMSELGHTFEQPSDAHRFVDQTIISNLNNTGQAGPEDEQLIRQLYQATDQCALKMQLLSVNQIVRTEYENRFAANYRDRLKN